METNGVNYYKGVLLCSRPNQSPSIPKEKPFCGRVTPHDALGLVPTQKFDERQVRKRNLPVLSNHKKWLLGFKKKIDEEKLNEEEQKKKEIERLEKIKQEGVKRRQNLKQSSSLLEPAYDVQKGPSTVAPDASKEEQKNAGTVQKRIKKKGQKPAWAKSDKQLEEQKQKQIDELLDFFEDDNVKSYLQDEQVNRMMKDLKARIQSMKKDSTEQGDWKKKEVQRIREAQEKQVEKGDDKKDDVLSRISRNSEAKSMISQKTAERVEELEKKKQTKEWDSNTQTDKKSNAAAFDEQIAKNVADEVLRNYPALKHHSNQSIRKLLQKQAKEQIKA